MYKKDTLKQKEYSVTYIILAVVYWFLSFFMTLLIFELSSKDGSDSQEMTENISSIFNSITGSNFFDAVNVGIIGHIFEFVLLTIFTFLALDSTNKISDKTSYRESPMKILQSDNEMNIILTLWFSILNAIFDEYHQLFISGRDGSIIDVGLDMIGVIIVLLMVRLIFTIYLRAKGKQEVRYSV